VPIQGEPLTRQSLAVATRQLAAQDKDLATIFKTLGPPPLWSRRPGFPTLVRIILEQQVSLASADSMFQRLAANVDPFEPERFVELGESRLRSLGMTRQKTSYCLDLARRVAEGNLKLGELSRMTDEDARTVLTNIMGIGPWSADIYLLMALRRPDVWPEGDLALATAVSKLKRLRLRPTPDRLLHIGDAWRPFRSVAARMLWQYYLSDCGLLVDRFNKTH
jgi:DNA-3-methyladenine glycosylase II